MANMNVKTEIIELVCPKCKEKISGIRNMLPIFVKLFFLPVITVKFTFQEVYHPACGYAKFECLELAELQKKVRNGEEVKSFLEYLVQKWMDMLPKK